MQGLDNRKEQLLAFVVREHSRTAEPVASEIVKERSGLEVSPATIRNEMAELEREGYLSQPHTSAGRVPTEAGYRYYIAHCLEEKDVDEDVKALQEMVCSPPGGEVAMKQLARSLASAVHEGVFVGFAPESTYYTGLTYLFDQPEFASVDLVRHMGEIVDNLDHIIAELFEEVRPGVRVYIGSENPFGTQCGTVLLKVAAGFMSARDEERKLKLAPTDSEAATMLGVLGPMRMNYDHAIAMMKGIERLLN